MLPSDEVARVLADASRDRLSGRCACGRSVNARQVMTQQQLSPEGLLARFFGKHMLSAYANAVGESPRGNPAVLAARISSHWQRVGVCVCVCDVLLRTCGMSAWPHNDHRCWC